MFRVHNFEGNPWSIFTQIIESWVEPQSSAFIDAKKFTALKSTVEQRFQSSQRCKDKPNLIMQRWFFKQTLTHIVKQLRNSGTLRSQPSVTVTLQKLLKPIPFGFVFVPVDCKPVGKVVTKPITDFYETPVVKNKQAPAVLQDTTIQAEESQ